MRLWPLIVPLAACQALPGALQGRLEQTPSTQLTVYASHPGSSATENEVMVARPLEEKLRTLPGVSHSEALAGDGFAAIRIVLRSSLGTDRTKAQARNRIERALPDLPQSLHRIFIWADAGGPTVDQVPAAWEQMPPSQFEASITALSDCRWSPASLEALARGLSQQGSTALRAAVLLAYDSGSDATALLLARLEERVASKERSQDAGDLVAAAALDGRGAEDELLPLVIGAAPHPDLEVRVECARTLLRAGREEVVPFLLTVLRALTPAEGQHPADWERVTTLMWAKSRAATALTDRLGIACKFRPDGAWSEQMAEADRLESLYAR